MQISLKPPAECSSSVYNELNEPNRYWTKIGGPLDDQTTVTSDEWYRFTGEAGKMMATYCIPARSCFSMTGSWISGDHPTAVYELVSTTICMQGLSGGCCSTSYPVKIRNCNGYYVYKLQSTGMFERYCGVNGKVYYKKEQWYQASNLLYHWWITEMITHSIITRMFFLHCIEFLAFSLVRYRVHLIWLMDAGCVYNFVRPMCSFSVGVMCDEYFQCYFRIKG